MTEPCIVVDICNTLADINGILDAIGPRRPSGTYLHPAITGPDFFVDNLWIFNDAKPVPGSQGVLKVLSETYRIVYLTARPRPSELVTRRWIDNNHYPSGRIIYSADKAAVALSLNARFAIEDSPYEVAQYQKSGILCFVPSADYNVSCSNRFYYEDLFKALTGQRDHTILEVVSKRGGGS